jgi:transposase
MSLQWQLSREVPADTAALGQKIFKPDNIYRYIGDHFDQLFPLEPLFAPLYDPEGRGAISPLLLAILTALQMLEKVPDRLAAEYAVTRLDWKYALHLPLAYTGFHFTDLYAFRQRLLAHGKERLVFDQVLEALKKMGMLKARGKIRTDSTQVLGVVERLSQLELVLESVRVALRAVTEMAPDWASQHLPATFSEAYELRQSEFGLSQAQVEQRLVRAGQDGFWFLAQLDREAPDELRHLPEVERLRTVLEQQFPGGPTAPPAMKRPSGKDIIESPHEPEVRRGTKRSQSWIGYKDQISETCEPDLPHLIVDLEATGALENDSPELAPLRQRLQAHGLVPGEHYVDQGYMSGKDLLASAQAGTKLMGVPLEDTQGPEGFRQADFAIDEAQQIATCPAGQQSQVWSEKLIQAAPQPQVQIRFAAAACQACAFFGTCTSSPQGRSLTLHPYRQALAARRAEAKTEAFRERMHRRAGIEATISELVRAHGLRQARYRGLAKLRLQNFFTALAVNLKRLARWCSQHPAVPALPV